MLSVYLNNIVIFNESYYKQMQNSVLKKPYKLVIFMYRIIKMPGAV